MTTPAESETSPRLTQHGMLVAFGHFAREIGLPEQLATIPIAQKTVRHTPAAKLTTFFMGLLTGIEYLHDLTQAPAPLYHDSEVAHAWGFTTLPEASGVSRTLAACTADSLTALNRALETVSHPFLERALADLRLRNQPLLLDIDLTGQPVSDTSTTYPDAAFGYMNGEVRLGYQIAAICLQTELYGRQWLAGQQHSGDTVSAPCLLALVAEAERRLGAHPPRRVALVEERLHAARTRLTLLEARQMAGTQQATACLSLEERLTAQIHSAHQQLRELQRQPVSRRQINPHGRVTRLREQINRAEHRLGRLRQQWAVAIQRTDRAAAQLAQTQAEITALEARRDQLAQDNQSMAVGLPCCMRMDAGFSTGPNLTALIELGYDVQTKAYGSSLLQALKKQLTAVTGWTRVGKNAEMTTWSAYRLTTCPYPVAVGLECFHTPHGEQYGVLIRYDSDPALSLKRWFQMYNKRGTVEAGIKQSKTVFNIQHPMSRSRVGMQMQIALTLFAANFLGWARTWLADRVTTDRGSSHRRLAGVKLLVRIAANSLAGVKTAAGELWIRFSSASGLAGVGICVTRSGLIQLALPFL